MSTYRDAGVDLEAADAVVAGIGSSVTATWGDRVIGGFGGFAAGLRLPAGYTNPVLMMSTDGVGTKAELARRSDRLDGLGWDLVAMCIDDLVATGARPIAMTDYLAVGKIDVERIQRLVTSVAKACHEADVALLGGETAEHPGVMEADAFDLAGAALGIVEEGTQIDGSAIRPGDVVIGVHSPNVRSNGFSLVRSVVLGQLSLNDTMPGFETATVAEVLLEPSVLYTPSVLAVIDQATVHGMAHVTGGGIPGNLPRILPADCDALIVDGSWHVPQVFETIADMGSVARNEMARTFNMGIGFLIVAPPAAEDLVLQILSDHGRSADRIGSVVAGTGTVQFT